jgi:hypothetical protein
MALSNQSDLPAFFSPRKTNLKIGLIREDEWTNPGRWLIEYGQISKDDLPRLAKSQLTTSRNLNTGFDETSSLKPSSGVEQFRLVVAIDRNF